MFRAISVFDAKGEPLYFSAAEGESPLQMQLLCRSAVEELPYRQPPSSLTLSSGENKVWGLDTPFGHVILAVTPAAVRSVDADGPLSRLRDEWVAIALGPLFVRDSAALMEYALSSFDECVRTAGLVHAAAEE